MRDRILRCSSLILVAALLSACGGKDDTPSAEATAETSALPVSLATAQQQTMARTVLVSGPVSAYEEMQLGVEISGQRVTALPVDVGQWVKKGQVLLQLDHRTLDSELAQADASLRQAQASQELARLNYQRSEKLADEETLYADLPTPEPLKPGIYVEGRIVTGDGQVLTIPTAAIVQRDGHSYVFSVNDKQQATRHRVRTGQAVNGHTAILEGLKAGDRVVVDGAGFLGEGDRVRVVANTKAAAR